MVNDVMCHKMVDDAVADLGGGKGGANAPPFGG